MTKAIASAENAGNDDAYRLDFLSIGAASPGNAAAIAIGLGVPVSTVIEALYRAPSVLIDGLSAEIGAQMVTLLTDLGCEVSLSKATTAAPEPATLVDVALHVTDVSRYNDIVAGLAAFLGCKNDEAARLISMPPGIVLGKVSTATVAALQEKLGSGAALVTSNPDAAVYDLFLAPCDAVIKSRLMADLRQRGHDILGDDGCIVAGLQKAEADALWSAHQRISELRVVNRDFLRFDLVLVGGTSTPAALQALTDVAGIPAHIAPRLFGEGDLTLMDAVPNTEMHSALERLTSAGLEIRADLVTFLHLGVEITAAPKPRAVAQALTSIGIAASEADLRRLPYRLPCVMPELQARMVCDALTISGAAAALIDTGSVS